MKRKSLFILIMLVSTGMLMAQLPHLLVCQANFTWDKDPIDPLIVNFTNTSSGMITDYLWDFGDGSTFSGENPSHAFPNPGFYTVCLTVWNSDTSVMCQDTLCENIPIFRESMYELGGLLFAGIYPVNNPVSTGDFAFAYLYRIEGNACVPADTVLFDTLGYFWFANVREGKYWLKAGLLDHSTHFHDFLPAYHGNKFNWYESDTLVVDHDIFNASIYMIPAKELTQGPGYIQGNLIMEQSTGGTEPLTGGQVVLADANGTPYRCDYAGADGSFRFDQVPAGIFQVFGEYTGCSSQRLDVSLDSLNPVSDSLSLRVYAQILGVEEEPATVPQVVVFPNPASAGLQVEITLQQPEEVEVAVYNHMGQQVRGEFWRMPSGKFREQLDVSDLKPAIYVITLRGTTLQWRVVKKFIKK